MRTQGSELINNLRLNNIKVYETVIHIITHNPDTHFNSGIFEPQTMQAIFTSFELLTDNKITNVYLICLSVRLPSATLNKYVW